MTVSMLQAGLAALLAGAPPPYAVGVLAVAPPPGPSAELVGLAVELRQALAKRRAGVLGSEELRQRMTGRVPGASLAELERAYEASRAAFLRGDHEGSASTLRVVLEELEKLPVGEEAFRAWMRALLRLARLDLDAGRAESARALADRLVRAWPEVELDRALHPARLARLVEAARASLRAQPTQDLVVASPGGARVFLNGREVGQAPLRLNRARGHYTLSAALGALALPPMAVELRDEPQLLALDFSVPASLRPGGGPGLALPEADRLRAIAAAGGYLGLDELVTVRLAEESGARYLIASLLDVRRGTSGNQARVRLGSERPLAGGVEELADFLVTGSVQGPAGRTPGAPTSPALEVLDALGRPLAPLPAPPPSSGFQLALAIAVDAPVGSAAGNARMDRWLGPQGSLALEGTWHLSAPASAGFHLRIGGGSPGPTFASLCRAQGSSCDTFVLGVAPLFRWSLAPGRPLDPWLAGRIGIEVNGGANDRVDFYLNGWEAALQGGLDLSVGDGSRLGLFATVSAGSYGTFTSSPPVDLGLGGGRALHGWLGMGLRLLVGR